MRYFRLAYINLRVTEASNAPGVPSTCATAAWIDFLGGWLSNRKSTKTWSNKMRWTKRPGLRWRLLHQRQQRTQRLQHHDPERQWWAAVVPKATVVAVRPAEDAVVVTAVCARRSGWTSCQAPLKGVPLQDKSHVLFRDSRRQPRRLRRSALR
jgi:hypothetical protein